MMSRRSHRQLQGGYDLTRAPQANPPPPRVAPVQWLRAHPPFPLRKMQRQPHLTFSVVAASTIPGLLLWPREKGEEPGYAVRCFASAALCSTAEFRRLPGQTLFLRRSSAVSLAAGQDVAITSTEYGSRRAAAHAMSARPGWQRCRKPLALRCAVELLRKRRFPQQRLARRVTGCRMASLPGRGLP